MSGNIVLIGFMGVGKTAVGRELAAGLEREFIETDSLIVEKAGKSIPEIFAGEGEIAFREMEIAAVKDVSDTTNAVIACGGGVALNRISIDRLRQNGVIVYLTASPKTILERTRTEGATRPLLAGDDAEEKIWELLKKRRLFYKSAADIEVNTSRKTVGQIVAEIISRLKLA